MQKKGKAGSYRLPIMLSVLLVISIFLPFGALPSWGAQSTMPAELIPGGMPFGVQLETNGVLIVGLSPVNSGKGELSPAAKAGLAVRDVIVGIDGRTVSSAADVTSALANSNGGDIKFTVERAGKRFDIKLTPIRSEKDGIYRAGIWIRDSAAGIGTITFICPGSNTFAGLGHGICDPDTGMLMPMSKGAVMNVVIGSVRKGRDGAPGELKGYFCGESVGALLGNTESGAYGLMSKLPEHLSTAVPTGKKTDVHVGEAYIICTLDKSSGAERHSIKISKIYDRDRKNKNFLVEVTDPALIDKTGGIVQGMSGSPIIQDGKLIGAITHVMVEDPKEGYGIFIENMLENMPEITRVR